MKFILGKKIEMTQIWKGDNVVAVTKVKAGPCTVVQVKTDDKDGYAAIQIGFDEKKEKNINKPQLGHMKKAKTNSRYLKEFRDNASVEVGNVITVDTFEAGDEIKVTGTSKGKGFQGVVKRHGFHGQKKTHGHKDQNRMPGSIGATDPQRVFKGLRMGGHMGDARVTVPSSEIVEVDKENNILYIKGGVPGARNSLVMIYGKGDLKTINNEQLTMNNKEEKVEEIKTEEVAEVTVPTEEAKTEEAGS